MADQLSRAFQAPADPTRRDLVATPEQLFRAHTEPDLFVRWVGPDQMRATVDAWAARDGGEWRYRAGGDGPEQAFRGCLHTVRTDRIVQTCTWEGMPDGVALETLDFTDRDDGQRRLHAASLCDSFEAGDEWLSSGMEIGVDEGYANLGILIASGAL